MLQLEKRTEKKKKKTLEILKSVLKKKKKKSSGEDIVGRCVVLCLYYKTLNGKFHTVRNDHSHFPVYSGCYGLNMDPLQNHMLES